MRTLLACMLAVTVSASAQQKPGEVPAGYWPEAKSAEVLKKTQTIRLAPDLSSLTAGEQAALKDLIEVGSIMQKLYEESRHAESRTALDQLRHLDVQLGQPKWTQNLLDLYRLNQGPIATTLANTREPFLPVTAPRPGGTLYPDDATRADLDAFMAAHPESRASILDVRTAVRRATKPSLAHDIQTLNAFVLLRELHPTLLLRLRAMQAANNPSVFYAVPYSVAFADDLVTAFRLLLHAADQVEGDDAEFAGYLRNRARDLVSNDYESGDASWVTGHFKHLNAQIGSYETYDDTLYGVKAAHGMSILIGDDAPTARARKAIAGLQSIEDALPYESHRRVRDDISVGVYNVIADFGQARGTNGATNLPNDPLFTRRYGRTILIRQNIMENPDFVAMQQRRWRAAVADAHASDFVPSAEIDRALWHEVGHYLGVDRTKDGRPLDEALQEHSDALEEMKSDLVALFALERMSLPDIRAIEAAGIKRVLLDARPRPDQPYQTMELVQFNWLVDQGVLKPDPKTARLTIDYSHFSAAITSLLTEVLRLQREGDKSAAAAFFERWTKWTPEVNEKLAARMRAEQGPRFWLVKYAALGE